MVTVAPATIAPVPSVTVPVMPPVGAWAHRTENRVLIAKNRKNRKGAEFPRAFIKNPFLQRPELINHRNCFATSNARIIHKLAAGVKRRHCAYETFLSFCVCVML